MVVVSEQGAGQAGDGAGVPDPDDLTEQHIEAALLGDPHLNASGTAMGASQRQPHHRARLLALVAAAVVLATVAVVAPRLAPQGASPRTGQSTASSATPTPTAAATDGSNAASARTDPRALDAELYTLFTTRASAIRRDDVVAWRRTQTSGTHVPVFARLAALPITNWSYHVESIEASVDQDSIVVIASVHYRFDVDVTDAVLTERLTLRYSDSGWLVTREATADPRAQPWDLGDLTVAHGRTSLVIGIDVSRSLVRRYAAIADAVTPDVVAVWGSTWNQRPVVIVPRSASMLGRGLGRTATSLDDFAAVTVSVGGTAAKSAMRIWTNTTGMASLSGLGREIVMRHEITHVATAAPLTPSVPLWLEEGFAEYVGYLGTRIPASVALGELANAVRTSHAPRHLPTASSFSGSQVDVAYEAADLACRQIAETYGQPALVRLYRLTVSGTGPAAANVDAALIKVTGHGTAAFEVAWRSRMSWLVP